MPSSLPLNLICAWALMFCFVLANEYHERQLKQSFVSVSPSYQKVLEISGLLGLVTGVGVLIYYFVAVSWYWPIALLVVGSLIGAALLGVVSGLVGTEMLGRRAVIGWPLSALWAIQIIHGLN